MKQFELSDSVTFYYGDAGFHDALELKNAIFNEIVKKGLKIEGLGSDFDLESLLKVEIKGQVFESIIKSILSIDTSKEVNHALFKCLSRCKINDDKVTAESFESLDIRPFYYVVKYHTIKETLLPFFQNLVSVLKPLTESLNKAAK